MKKAAWVVTAIFVSVMFFTAGAYAADKFAYVDLAKIFSDYGKTKDYDKILGDKENAYTSERDKKINEVKQIQDKMNLLSDKEKASKSKELETKVKSLREFDAQRQGELRKEQEERMKEIFKDIEATVKQYAEKEGYTLVFNEKILVYGTNSMDITDKILDMLNKGKK